MKMNLGVKISMGFVSLLVISAILGILAIVNMSSVKSSLIVVAEVNAAELLIMSEVERDARNMAANIRFYALSEDENFLIEGKKGIAQVRATLDKAKKHVQKHPTSTLAKTEVEMLNLLLEYEKLVNLTQKNEEKVVNLRKSMDFSATDFMVSCFVYLRDQEAKHRQEHMTGASKSTLMDRMDKITLINDVIDLGNDSRIKNFKFQALRKKEFVEEALGDFAQINEKLELMAKITKKEASVNTLKVIKKAADAYKKEIQDYLDKWQKIHEVSKTLTDTGRYLTIMAQAISDNIKSENLESYRSSIASLSTAINVMVLGLVIALIIGVILAIIITRSVSIPAISMAKTARAIAAGDIMQNVTFVSNDELGELADSFREMIFYLNDVSQIAGCIAEGDLDVEIKKRSEKDMLSGSFTKMIASLKESVQIAHAIGEGNLDVEVKQRSQNDGLGKALQNMARNLKRVMSELSQSTSVLNAAASEILVTTSQIASTATQTSSAVSQTTASVEEIKQTARLTSEKAVHTAESTKKAVSISDEGNFSLDKNMSGLAQIKEKMDLIAVNIIKLSEQSQMIGNIVSTVEDIASQSNLLAVNASIEAVKAGEHGKGFSVVAQELKNLANQSKQGTSEVQKILTDIQQATNTLVMVAEQGSKAVDEGVIQAKSAKKSMESLRKSVMEAAQSGTLIAISSEQEMAGMDQISGAMMGIKEATFQNMESIRQVESAAKNLSLLSHTLKALMEGYSFGR